MKAFNGFRSGVNLGGWFSQCVHTEEHYDSFIKDEDFAVIRSWGADHVRVPVDHELLEDDRGNPRESGYERLERTVKLCRSNGLNMIIDLHKAAGFSFDPNEGETGFFDSEAYQRRFYALWESIAERFARYADVLAFELLNEVTEKEYCDAWNRIAGECIGRIRRYAPDIPILVGGYYHNSAVSVKDIRVPLDGGIVYNFHCYEPLIFTHQGAYWMETMDRSFRIPVGATFGEMDEAGKRMLNGTSAGIDALPNDGVLTSGYFEDFMREAVLTAERDGVPLYCGEYGVIDLASPEDALKWYGMITAAFEKYDIGRAAWSYRRMDFGLSDERMDGVRGELIRILFERTKQKIE